MTTYTMLNTKETTEGRRIEARSFADGQVDAVRRYWYNDQWQVLTQGYWSQAYASLTLSRNYIYGNTIDEVLGFEWVVKGTPGMRYYYLHDHLYSPAAMLTDYGIVERYEYDAYGRRSVMTPGFAHRNNSHYLSDIGLTGREIDELDLDATATPRLQHMHYRHRDYSPQLGRFMQQDPLGINPHPSDGNYFLIVFLHYFDGLSLYEYVSSQPIVTNDAFGLMPVLDPGIGGGWRGPVIIPSPGRPIAPGVPGAICENIDANDLCRGGCLVAYVAGLWKCDLIPIRPLRIVCEMVAAKLYDECLHLCDLAYPPKE